MVQLWNPSLRKFEDLPPVCDSEIFQMLHGFGYDPISDNYKVVVVFGYLDREDSIDNDFSLNEVKVLTLGGTDSWKSVSKFPFAIQSFQRSGQYVSGTINWSVSMGTERFIASFNLGNECYQKIDLPDDLGKVDDCKSHLTVFKDCLCMILGENVWVMKEYGNKESWTKLFTISCMRDPFASSYPNIHGIHVFEDEQVLLVYSGTGNKRFGHISYNHKNDTSKLIELEDIPGVCVESLISPCF
jgi:F-box interacting protein